MKIVIFMILSLGVGSVFSSDKAASEYCVHKNTRTFIGVSTGSKYRSQAESINRHNCDNLAGATVETEPFQSAKVKPQPEDEEIIVTGSDSDDGGQAAKSYLVACKGSSKKDAEASQNICVKETKCVGGKIQLGEQQLTDESCNSKIALTNGQKFNSCVAYAEKSVGEKNQCAQEIQALDREGSDRGDVEYQSDFDQIVFDGGKDEGEGVVPSTDDCMGFVDALEAASLESFVNFEATTFTMQPDVTLLSSNSCTAIYPKSKNGGKFYLRDFSNWKADPKTKEKICRAYIDTSFDDTCRDHLITVVNLKNEVEEPHVTRKNDSTTKLKACFKGDENKSIKRLVTSCMALSIGQRAIDEHDEDETDYYTVDASQQGFTKGGFGCFKNGSMALDYISCKQAAYGFNGGFLTADVALEIGSEVYGAMKSNDINQDEMTDSANPDKNQTASMNAVRRRHQLERDKQHTKMVIQSGKGAMMVGLMMAYTTPKEVRTSWCERGKTNNEYKMTKPVSCILSAMVDDSQESDSGNYLNGERMVDYLFPNQEVKSNLAKDSIKSLSKALVAGIIADMKDKQAKLVGSVQDAFEGANYNQPVTGIDTSGLPKFCDENPTAPSCKDFNGDGNPNGGGIQFDFGNNGNSNPNAIGYDTDPVDIGNGAEVDKEKLSETELDDLSNIMGDTGGDKGSKDFNRVAAGKISTSKRSGGGGGGGGAGGGGSGGGGGGGDAGPGGSNPNAGSLGGKTNTKYASGSGGKYSSGGGKSKNSKGSRNPFAGLSGRKRSRGIASRGPSKLLAKNIRLFSAISKRYNKVNSDGRLEVVRTSK